jgi:protein SCO1
MTSAISGTQLPAPSQAGRPRRRAEAPSAGYCTGIRLSFGALALGLLVGGIPRAGVAQTGLAPAVSNLPGSPEDQIIKKVRLDQKLNAPVPLELTFRDETGKPVTLRQYFGRKPVIMNLIQYRCRMLCSQEMAILAHSLKQMRFSIGKQFLVLTVSIDPRETSALAAAYKAGYVKAYARPGAAAGWHFLTGDAAAIRRLADAIGYHFTYDARTDQFAHPDGVIILTPKGKIDRYFMRLQYPAPGLRLSLVEAAAGKIGTPIDALALLCCRFDPATGRYGLAFMKVLQGSALATMLAVGAIVLVMNGRGRRVMR